MRCNGNKHKNVLYLNNEEEETPLHLCYSCLNTKQLWHKLRQYFSQFINISHSIPKSFILEIFDNNQHSELINHLLLIFKLYIYSARNTKQLNFDILKITIKKIKEIEKKLNSSNKLKLLKKWHPIGYMIGWYSVQNEKGEGQNQVILSCFLIYYTFLVCLLFLGFFCLKRILDLKLS